MLVCCIKRSLYTVNWQWHQAFGSLGVTRISELFFSDTHGGSLVICDVLVGIEVGVIVGLKVSISVVDVSAVVTGVVEINGVGV